jgi:hypothetical protein
LRFVLLRRTESQLAYWVSQKILPGITTYAFSRANVFS